MTVRCSSKFRSASSLAGILAVAVIAASPAMGASVTFAQYLQTNGSEQQWTITSTGSSTTVTASGSVLFQFSGVLGLPFSGPEAANFLLTATSAQAGNCGVACGPGDSFVQPGYSGTFSFIDAGSAPGVNLLSGTFAVTGSPSTTGAQFSSSVGGNGGSFNASATAGNINQLVLTSAYLSFVNQNQEDASWSLSSLIPIFATGPVTLGTAFPAVGTSNAAGSGTFSSNPGPVAVPEPASLGLIGGGLSLLAMVCKRRTKAASGRH
jgi:hypothetical protein